MKKAILALILVTSTQLFADNLYRYSIDLVNVVNDKVQISLETPPITTPSINFNFPATIPGTYATEDYGRFITEFHALDANGKDLTVQKISNNTFQIANATNLKSITYKVDDSFDSEIKKDKIFEPAGTNIEKGKNFTFNNCGFFGFFDGMEKMPVELNFSKTPDLYGVTAMKQLNASANNQKLWAQDYHQLVDCPILFAKPDTVSFKVNNTHVTLAVYAESGQKMANDIYDEMKASMEAIAKFLPALPVEKYAFLIYVADYRNEGAMMQKPSAANMVQLISRLAGKGFGALEHGNSSLYYMPDFGLPGMEVKHQMKDVAIHEFMHIITPLGLHSQHIGNFNFVNPVMSRHLWLYEGITEYFAGLIQLQGGLITQEAYNQNIVRTKIISGNRFPIKKMSMTEMSANVLKKPYHKEYAHVYDRGAILGLLLDTEIIRLTDGKLTLKEVVLKLRNKYGANNSFDEQNFIKEFVAEVHPDLQKFFDTYVSGKTDWNLKSLNNIGIDYQPSVKLKEPKNPFSGKDNDIKIGFSMIQIPSMPSTIKKVGKKEWAGLQAGDQIQPSDFKTVFKDKDGNWMKEGETVQISVKRNEATKTLPIKVTHIDKDYKHYVQLIKERSATQDKYYQKWLGK